MLNSQQQRAVVWLITAVSSFSALDAVAKLLTRTMPITSAVWFRYAIPTTLIALWLFSRRGARAFHTAAPRIQFLRGLMLVASTLSFWTALKHLPLVEAATVSFISPALTVVLSSIVLREKADPIHWVALAIGFLGVLVVLRPGFSHPSVGAIAALVCAVFYALYQILTRKVAATHDPMVMLFYANAVGAALLSTIAPATFQAPRGWEWAGVLALGTISGFGHWCMIRAYENADAPTLAPFMYSQLAVTTLVGWLVFNALPDGYTLLGMLIIIGSGLIVMIDVRRKGQPEPRPASEPE